MSTDPQKFQQDQQHDIAQLRLLKQLFADMRVGLADPAYDRARISQHLQDMSTRARSIRWNVSDANYVRNKLGKFNYKSGKENKRHFIDLILLAEMGGVLQAENMGALFADFLLSKSDVLAQELATMDRSISFELHRLGKGPMPVGGVDQPFAVSTTLYMGIQYWLDNLVIDKLHQFFLTYQPVAAGAKEWVMRYHAARLITIVGEAVKLLSTQYKEAHATIPLQAFIRLRDKIAHDHRHLINAPTAEFAALFPTFLRDGIRDLMPIIATLRQALIKRNQRYGVATAAERVVLVRDNFISVAAKLSDLKIVLADSDSVSQFAGQYPADVMTLIEVRLYCLKRDSLNQAKQTLHNLRENPNPGITRLDKLLATQARAMPKIIELEAKAGPLSAQETRQLAGMRANVAKVEAQIQKERANPQPGIAEQIQALSDKVAVLTADITALEVCPTIFRLDRSSKQARAHHAPAAGAAPAAARSETAQFNRYVRRWNAELELLVELREGYRASAAQAAARHLELEYSLAVIGQLFRDMQKSVADEMATLSNLTIDDSVRATIAARNTDIMHNPFANLTTQLINCSDGAVTPLTHDARAMLALSDEEFVNQVHSNRSSQAEHLNNLAVHYMRIGRREQALACVEQACPLLFTHNLEQDHGILGEVTQFEVYDGDTETLQTVLATVDHIPGRIVILRVSQREALARYTLLGNIAAAYAAEETDAGYARGLEYVGHARYAFNRTAIRAMPDFGWQPLSLSIWMSFKVNPRPFVATEYAAEITAMTAGSYSIYAAMIINIAATQAEARCLSLLQGLDLTQITNLSVRFGIHVHMVRSLLSSRQAQVPTAALMDGVFSRLESAKLLLQDNRGELIAGIGDHIRKLTLQLAKACTVAILHAQKLALRNQDAAMLEHCLRLCDGLTVDTDWLRFNLANIYSRTSGYTNRQGLARFRELLTQLEQSDNPVIRTKTLFCWIFYYEGFSLIPQLLQHLVKAYQGYQALDDVQKQSVPEYGDCDSVLQQCVTEHAQEARAYITQRERLVSVLRATGRAVAADQEQTVISFLRRHLPSGGGASAVTSQSR